MASTFRVGITRDILDSRGEPAFGRAALADPRRRAGPRVGIPAGDRAGDHADHAARYDALYVNMARVPAAAVARADCRLRVVARHGVGYDSVDVAGDDARRHRRHQHAELDAAPGRDDRADVHPGARRQADAEGPAHAHRPLARADGQHGHGPHRPHARRGRRRPHRQGAAAHGARVRPEAARRRSRTSTRSSSATSARARSTSTRCCASRTSSSSAACSTTRRATSIGARAVRADEADRVFHQRRARPDRRRGRADRGAARAAASPAPRSTCSSRSRSIPPIRCSRWTT